MTEDDTFKMLCRPTFDEIGIKFDVWLRSDQGRSRHVSGTPYEQRRDLFFKENYWTHREYIRVHNLQSNQND